jgi:hypothetical protein
LIWLQQDKLAMPSEMVRLLKVWTVLRNICINMPDGMIEGIKWRARHDECGHWKVAIPLP